jgi:hypothetical protein
VRGGGGGGGGGGGAVSTSVQLHSYRAVVAFGLTRVRAWGPSPLLHCILRCTAIALHGMREGVEVTWKAGTGTKAAAFPPVKSSSANQQGKGDAMQAARQAPTRSVMAVGQLRYFSMQEQEPGASFQTLHTGVVAWFCGHSTEHSCFTGNSRKQPANGGGDRRVNVLVHMGIGKGEKAPFFFTLLFP